VKCSLHTSWKHIICQIICFPPATVPATRNSGTNASPANKQQIKPRMIACWNRDTEEDYYKNVKEKE
jgi:hypothetical protein